MSGDGLLGNVHQAGVFHECVGWIPKFEKSLKAASIMTQTLALPAIFAVLWDRWIGG